MWTEQLMTLTDTFCNPVTDLLVYFYNFMQDIELLHEHPLLNMDSKWTLKRAF